MLKKISIALFAILFVTACGTSNNVPGPNDMPGEEDIAPDNQEKLDPRNEDGIDEEEMQNNQPDIDMKEKSVDENDHDEDLNRNDDNRNNG